ncbi:hypothetical protein TIFTF001_043966 [Ficus carica]|uniref:Uncharacterized protein n=1 Tax=Ficus carica TaxID=3494 RepID=A0AA87ZH12_FICCA|nr:hypothetical protein TIFTF001_043966 [Ficus carica]
MSGVISQGTTNTSSQSLPQFQTGQPREINSSGVLVQDENLQQQQHNNNASREGNDVTLQSQGDHQQREGEQNFLLVPQSNGAQIPGKTRIAKHEPDRPHNPDSECESQYLKLQKMSNQQATVAEQASNPPIGSAQTGGTDGSTTESSTEYQTISVTVSSISREPGSRNAICQFRARIVFGSSVICTSSSKGHKLFRGCLARSLFSWPGSDHAKPVGFPWNASKSKAFF